MAGAPANVDLADRSVLRRLLPRGPLNRRYHWHVFRVFNVCRLVIGALILGLYLINPEAAYLGVTQPVLFLGAASGYVFGVTLSIALSLWRRPTLPVQAHAQTLLDIIALSAMAQASGGIDSNLTVLLVSALAASTILLPLASSLLAALTAFLIVSTIWLDRALTASAQSGAGGHLATYMQGNPGDLGQLAALGATFLLATLITHSLAERTRRSEDLVRQRSQELFEIAQLNQVIVRHLQAGVVVVDRQTRIRLINPTACALLDCEPDVLEHPLGEVAPALGQRLAAWLATDIDDASAFRHREHLPDLSVRFSHLEVGGHYDTMILLEDASTAAQRLQQIKLAAVGRLTAGIAHEIRNPLASISHAGQLLQESTTAGATDQRLAQIIHDNARRAARIIGTVLDLSRRGEPRPETIALAAWLNEYTEDFRFDHSDSAAAIELRMAEPAPVIRFDPVHLRQVVDNLCTNACRHGTAEGEAPRVRIDLGRDARGRPYLDVVDYGAGIAPEHQERVFEPFFTTKTSGTGLGLYLSREICEANGAQLQYLTTTHGGRFRLLLPAANTDEE